MSFEKIVDSHVHSNYSDDSTMRPEDAAVAAMALGLKGIVLTDHYDLDFPDKQFLFEFDIPKRAEHVSKLQQEYGNRLKILQGIELGIQPHIVEKAEAIVDSHDFDFVICSIHAVDGYALHDVEGFYDNKSKQQAYRRYLEEVYFSVCNLENYDVIGHLGYIRRYGRYENKTLHYKEYDEIIDQILKRVISSNKGIEINVSGYAYHLGSAIPDGDIVKRYKELGGEIITLGSDAHNPAHVGKSFKQGLGLLERSGFEYVTYFQDRKPIFESIK